MTKLMEAAPSGSLERIREDLSKAFKIANFSVLGEFPWIRYVFPTYIIVDGGGRTWAVNYVIKDKAISLSAPVEMEDNFVLKESGITLKKGIAKDVDIDIDFVSLKEAKFDEVKSEVEVVLIEAGTNLEKKRHYPESTIREAAPMFKGWKMYINHPTKTDEKEIPERKLQDWASTIVESSYSDGKAIGKIVVHDTWLRERLKDPVFREHVGLSINTGGKLSVGKVNGKEMYIVEAIGPRRKDGPGSVDWVTEPGARGRVSRLLESRTREDVMIERLLENATLVDLKDHRKDLVESIAKEAVASKEAEISTLKESIRVANDKIAKFEIEGKLGTQKATVETQLKESKAPDAVKNRVREAFNTTVFEGNLQEAVTNKLKSELDYASKLSGKGTIKLGDNGEVNLQESIQNDLDARAGVAKKEEKK